MTSASGAPPLSGDRNGCYRVHITGNHGTGKVPSSSFELVAFVTYLQTTTGGILAAMLGVPHIHLDELYWQPGWKESTREEFQTKIREKLDEDNKGWVVDGDFTDRGDIVLSESTDVIWLDPPLLLYFPRIFYRTILSFIGLQRPCSPGCSDSIREVFSKQGILWWCLSHHWHHRHIGHARMAEIGLGVGTSVEGRRMRRFGGWGGELKRWLKEVRRVCVDSPEKKGLA